MKVKYLILVLISIVLLSIIFTSCKKDDNNPTDTITRDSRLVGNWSLTKVTVVITSQELTPEQAGFMITVSAGNDGKFQMNTTDSTGTLQQSGTWSTSGNVITVNYDDGTSDTMEYTVSDNAMTVNTQIEMQPGSQILVMLDFIKS